MNDKLGVIAEVDTDKCNGCALCYETVAENFVDRGDGKAVCFSLPEDVEGIKKVLAVGKHCPANAIKIK